MRVLGFEPRKALSTSGPKPDPFDHSGTPAYYERDGMKQLSLSGKLA